MNKAERTKYNVPTVVLPLHTLKARYRTFLSVPMRYRPDNLRTIEEFASFYNIKPALLQQWESEPGFWDEVFNGARAVAGRALADVIDALVMRAKGGNVNAIKLALEMLGVHHDKLEVQHTKQQDQIIMVLPPGMSLPDVPVYGSDPVLAEGEEVLTQTHLGDDFDFVIRQPYEPANVPGMSRGGASGGGQLDDDDDELDD